MNFKIVNPYTGKEIAAYPVNSTEDISDALDRADKYFTFQRRHTFGQRAQQLGEIAKAFHDNAEILAKTATENMGKRYTEALAEANAAGNIAQYYADNGPKALTPKPYTYLGDKQAQMQYESTGIVFAIEPWNFPYTQVMRVFAPNFLLGNPVILKHAPIVAGCADQFEKTVYSVMHAHGGFQNLFLTNDQAAAIIADDRVQGVALTGSTKAGRIVASEAAQALTKTTLELGGNDAFVVLPDADIDQAVADGAISRLRNAGQVCTSAKRYIVTEANADEFVTKMKATFEQQVLGDPMADDTTIGPMSSERARDQLQLQVDTAVEHGAEILVDGGAQKDRDGFFFKPMLLGNLKPDNPMYDAEFFGPVGQVHIVKDTDEAIQVANDTQYGLAGAVYSQDLDEAKRVADQLITGQIFLNQPSNGYPELPFGGVKSSGYGREMSDQALYEFANKKMIARG